MFGKLVHRFIAGGELADALSAASDLNSRGIGGISDLLGEGVKDLAGAAEASQEYLSAVAAIAEKGIDATVSLKLSQLGLVLDPAACASNLAMILERAHDLGVGVEVDMEQSELVDASLKVFREAGRGAAPGDPSGHSGKPAPVAVGSGRDGGLEAADPTGEGCLRRTDRQGFAVQEGAV
jgi:hypothetical protein